MQMKILFVAATSFELHQFVENLDKIDGEGSMVSSYRWHDLDIDVIITGLGMVFTTYNLTRVLRERKYDLVINAGIAGSFSDELSIGTVVNVTSIPNRLPRILPSLPTTHEAFPAPKASAK